MIFPSLLMGQQVSNQLIEEEKMLSVEWVKSLTDREPRKIITGEELNTIGMPCGGIAAGQLYVRGDGTLACWWIANNGYNTGYGIEEFMNFNTEQGPWKVCYQTYEPFSYIKQGFDIVVDDGQREIKKSLSRSGFNNIGFVGEYPVAAITYNDSDDPLPVDISLEVYSPFIPLNSFESALPATVLSLTLSNNSEKKINVDIQGYLQNMVMLDLKNYVKGQHRNKIVRNPGISSLYMDFIEGSDGVAEFFGHEVFEDFEKGTQEKWSRIDEDVFNKISVDPTTVTNIKGFKGKGVFHSGAYDKKATGKLVSKPFKIEKKYISFLVAGFKRSDKNNISLLINNEVVRKACGDGTGDANLVNWDVSDFLGQKARIEINDNSANPSHYIVIDEIILADSPIYMDVDLKNHAFNGDMSLSLMGESGKVTPNINGKETTKPLGEELTGGVNCSVELEPGESRGIDYLLSWYFPNRPKQHMGGNWNKSINIEGEKIGNMYANWFSSSIDVARYIQEHFTRLKDQTHLFQHAFYNETTIPYWLSQRVMMPVSTLATETCQWWATGKFWAWEGVGSCLGTCTHVWNYEQALARLFPDLEQNIRERTDFSTSFRDDGGIFTRNGAGNVHLDGQSGTILKSYREYLMSDNILFLSRNWDKIKMATEYLILQDENDDGLIVKQQRNTYDIAFMGANTYVGGLYLAALRAAENLAMEMKDYEFAKRCRNIYTSGKQLSSELLWNGEYFFQDVDLEKYPINQYANGCLSDQLFGQTWAHQLKLGYIYPKDQVRDALSSIWKYNWTSDVGKYNDTYPPERYYARKGEYGLINCTWPLSKHLEENAVRYRNEVWTGIEYQVATNMIYEGMITEGLSIVKAIHERYNPRKHNPWNEIECGDHYARALASWGVLIALEDFYYNGNSGTLSYRPRIQSDNFKGFFTAARGWGNISQRRVQHKQFNAINLKWGHLTLRELNLDILNEPTAVKLMVNEQEVECRFNYSVNQLTVRFEEFTLLPDIDMEIIVEM
jgi:non-lysosomal glucosylceramidase